MVDALDNEANLVKLAIAGDFDSFAVLYAGYLDPIYRYIYFRTGEPQESEDLTEQVFLKAWEALPEFKPIGRFFINWLYRIAHNLVVDFHRRRSLVAYEDLQNHTHLPDQAQEPALEAVIKVEEKEILASAIAQLPEDHQQFIALRFIEGLAHAEIAQILDKSEVACRGIQYRALASLNKILREEQEKV